MALDGDDIRPDLRPGGLPDLRAELGRFVKPDVVRSGRAGAASAIRRALHEVQHLP